MSFPPSVASYRFQYSDAVTKDFKLQIFLFQSILASWTQEGLTGHLNLYPTLSFLLKKTGIMGEAIY